MLGKELKTTKEWKQGNFSFTFFIFINATVTHIGYMAE